jgi:hypothetical protein
MSKLCQYQDCNEVATHAATWRLTGNNVPCCGVHAGVLSRKRDLFSGAAPLKEVMPSAK